MKILLVVYDNGSYVHTFPQGTAYIAAALRKAGHSVTIWQQDVHHWPDSALTDYLDNHTPFDVVGLGVIGGYWQYQRLKGLSKAINASEHRPDLFLLGGHGPSPIPEYFLQVSNADVVVVGEGEATVLEVVMKWNCPEPGCFSNIKGIAYVNGYNKLVQTPRRDPLDVDSIEWPAYDLFPIEYYRLASAPMKAPTDFVMPVASGRGCPYQCNFCYRMDKGYRPRDPKAITAEVLFLQRAYGITYIDFSDELLMISEDRVEELCTEFERIHPFKWTCNGRLNIAARSKETLDRMKRAGCAFINYGVESFDDQILKNMNKHLTTAEIVKGVENTQAVGIASGLNVIWGNLGEDRRTLQQSVDFLVKYADTSHLRTIRPVTPYPGSDLFYYAIKHGLLKDAEDFYENKHKNSDLVSVNFTDLSDDDFHQALMEANCALIEEHYRKVTDEMLVTTEQLYQQHNISFRGFRQM